MKILNVLFILSAIWLSANEMAVPERWKPPKIAGKEYLVGLKPRKYIIEDPKMMEKPLFRDAIWVIYRDSGIAVDFLGKALKRTDLHYNAAITKTKNPLLIKTTCYYTETEKNVGITEESWKAFKEASGDRIIGTMSCECIQSYPASKKRYNLPAAKSREEAYEQLRGTWNCRTMSQFRDLSVFYNWGLPRYAGTATYFDHMLMEFGAKCAGHESGCGIHDMPMQIAVSRGAARQYGTFFYSYFASHCRTLNYPGQDTTLKNTKSYSHRDYYNFLAPYERRTNFLPPHKIGIKDKPWNTYTSSGPECGIMDCDYLRCMIYSYMGGCGIYIDESGQKFMHSLYDYRTIDQEDPLVINLRDRKYHVSKTGDLLVDFYGRIASKIDRGVVCTPIALVWDRYHGYGPKYSGIKPWIGLFPLPGDSMFSALENFIFPASPLTVEAITCRTSPFGDIFDVITNDASQEAMDAYPALLLTGDVSMGRGFGERLLAYVKKGGILIASRCQLKELEGLPELSGKDGVCELALGKGRLIVSSKDYWLDGTAIDASLGDVIRKVAVEQLPVKVEGDVQYMVNKTGEGVIVALFNNYGNVKRRTWEKPDQGLDASETRKVSITLKHAASEAVELISERSLSVNGDRIEMELPGGDVKLVRIKKKIELSNRMNGEKYISLLKNAETFIGRNYHSDESDAEMAYFGNGESNNWPMQCTAKAFSALVAMGDKERALPMLRYILATHVSGRHVCSDGKKWGHTWIAAGGSLERMMSAIYKIENDLTEQDRKALRRVLLSESEWILHHLPVLAGIDGSKGKNKPESNIWNGSILVRTALMYPDAPHAAEYMERGKVLLVNGICTPGDDDARKVGANYTDNLSLDHHGYLNTGYMVICLLHIAILHNDCRLLGKEAPQEAYRHVKELWQLVKSCISPQGRLLRIGGDTRVRYAYCQSYLPIVCRFAGDYLGDAEAYKLGEAALSLLEAEQASNADHSFFGERLGEIKRISPLYYLRCEADVLNMLALASLWPKSSAKAADIPLLAKWQDEFHGARMSRDGRTLRSWVCRGADGPVGLCVPLGHGDMAEWLHNLAGEVRVAGRCRAVEVRRNMNENSGCMELVWRTEQPFPEGEQSADIVRQKLAFALLPDGRTMLFVNRMTAFKYFNLAGGDGMNLKIPNDFFNQEKRVYAGTGTSRMNVDDAISLVSLDSGKRLKLTRAKQRNTPICRYPYFNSLKVDVLGLPMEARSVERGEILADCAYATVADSTAEELPQFSGKAVSDGKATRIIHWKDSRTGREWRFVVDFDNLTAALEEVKND